MKTDGSIRGALLTAPAPGAIAVIRIVGANAWGVISSILKRIRGHAESDMDLDRPTLVSIVDGDDTVDEALLVRRSTGGIDDIEVSVHGGMGITQRVLELLSRHGVCLGRPDELPPRGALHPVEADADRALLACESRRLTQFLLAQRNMLPRFLDRLHLLSGDQRIAYEERTRVAIRLVAGMRVAIVGPPNAGKSTLANALIGRHRVIVADLPGTTRDWVSETALVDGWPITLTDTAGIRDTTDTIEAEAIRRGKEQAASADATVVLLDGTCDAEACRRTVDELMTEAVVATRSLIAINKADTMSPEVLAESQANLPGAIAISAKQGLGLDNLRRDIASMLGLDVIDEQMPTGFLSSHLPY